MSRYSLVCGVEATYGFEAQFLPETMHPQKKLFSSLSSWCPRPVSGRRPNRRPYCPPSLPFISGPTKPHVVIGGVVGYDNLTQDAKFYYEMKEHWCFSLRYVLGHVRSLTRKSCCHLEPSLVSSGTYPALHLLSLLDDNKHDFQLYFEHTVFT